MVAVRWLELLLAVFFTWSRTRFFPHYVHIRTRLFGINPIDDQHLAGLIMLIEATVVTGSAFAGLALRAAGGREQDATTGAIDYRPRLRPDDH